MTPPKPPLVHITSTDVKISVQDVGEAKLALKELKLKKREVALQKKQVKEQMQSIRASYTDEVRRQGSMAQGSGLLAGLARSLQRRAAIASTPARG